MKRFCIYAAVLLCAGGVFSVNAQDLLVMRDGNMIEAKVTEISPSEIRYKRFDHLDGPTIVIPAADVLSIRYENGMVQAFNAAPAEPANAASTAGQEGAQTKTPQTTAMDPNKFIFGINVNGGGALSYLWGLEGAGTGAGPSLTFEFGKGNFNSEIHLVFPGPGVGLLATFNGFWPRRNGGGYFGGGIGYSFYYLYYPDHSLTVGLNGGYKFVAKSGFYVRTGAFLGFDFGVLWNEGFTSPIYFKPDLAIGWTMR